MKERKRRDGSDKESPQTDSGVGKALVGFPMGKILAIGAKSIPVRVTMKFVNLSCHLYKKLQTVPLI